MASVNNPETTQTEAGRTTPRAPQIAPTEIRINGQTFDLAGMSAAEGAELYNALPQDVRAQADVYAKLAKRFERAQNIALPGGMSFDNAWANTVAALRAGRGQLPPNSEQYMKDIAATFRDQINQIPGMGIVNGANNVSRNSGDLVGGGADFLMMFPRALSAAFTTGGEGRDALSFSISDNQARAFGAAFAGSVYYEGIARRAQPLPAQFIGNLPQYAPATLEWAAVNTPILGDVWPYIAGSAQWLYQLMFREAGTPAARWQDVVEGVRDDIAERRSSGRTSFADIATDHMRDTEAARGVARVQAAGSIAGVETAELGDLANQGGVYTDRSGVTRQFSTNNGNVTDEAVLNANGQEQGRLERIGAAWSQAISPVTDELFNDKFGWRDVGILGTAAFVATHAPAAAAATGTAIASGTGILCAAAVRGVAYGAAAGGGAASGVLRGAGEFMRPGNEASRLAKVESRFEALNAERDGLGARRLAAEARVERAQDATGVRGWFEQHRAQSELNKIDNRIKSVDARMNERTGLFGRKIEGAQDRFEKADAALEGAKEGRRSAFGRWRDGVANLFDRGGRAVEEGAATVTREAASRAGGEAAGQIVRNASHLSRAARWGGRLARFVPGIGLIGTGAALLMRPNDAHAEEYRDGANYLQRLDQDLARGTITQAEFNAYRGLQTVYFGTGLGGIITGGITEAVQTGAEHLDRERMSRYLPPSIVADVTQMVQGNDGAAGRADRGLMQAAIERNGGATAFSNSNVTVGAVTRNEDGTLPAPGRPEMRERQFIVS